MIGFVISATAHSVLFRFTLGLDYFSLASISDVTMGGFIVVPYVLLLLALIWAIWQVPTLLRQRRANRFAAWLGGACGLMIGVAYMLMTMERGGEELALSGNMVIASGGPPECHQAKVHWLGERNVVARCNGAVTVLREPGAMSFRKMPD